MRRLSQTIITFLIFSFPTLAMAVEKTEGEAFWTWAMAMGGVIVGPWILGLILILIAAMGIGLVLFVIFVAASTVWWIIKPFVYILFTVLVWAIQGAVIVGFLYGIFWFVFLRG